MNKQIELKNCDELWDKCMYNPISDISFEIYRETFSYLKVIMRFCNEPDTVYSYLMLDSEQPLYTRPVESIKRLMPEYLHNKIIFYYTPVGTLVVLKGSFYDFPIDKLMSYYNIEKLSVDRFALYEKNRKNGLVGISNYFKQIAIRGKF